MQATVTARRPADCDLEWGKAFEMRAKGSAIRLCYGDTVMDKALPVLAYGEVWQRGGFTCKSEQTGVTCFNAIGAGFRCRGRSRSCFEGSDALPSSSWPGLTRPSTSLPRTKKVRRGSPGQAR